MTFTDSHFPSKSAAPISAPQMELPGGSVTGGFKHVEREVGGDGKSLKLEGKPA